MNSTILWYRVMWKRTGDLFKAITRVALVNLTVFAKKFSLIRDIVGQKTFQKDAMNIFILYLH